MHFCPTGTRRNDNVITTLFWRHNDIFCVVCPLEVYIQLGLCMDTVLSFPGIWQLCIQRENGSKWSL